MKHYTESTKPIFLHYLLSHKSVVDMVDDYILVQEFDPMGGLCRRLSIYSHILKSRPM